MQVFGGNIAHIHHWRKYDAKTNQTTDDSRKRPESQIKKKVELERCNHQKSWNM